MEFLGTKGQLQFNKNFEVNSSDRMVFRISTENEVSRIEYEANKRLFSKAPEMLEMLNDTVIHLRAILAMYPKMNHVNQRILKIQQLIKEATEL